MSLITRQEKGEKLTIQEMDGNLTFLEGLARPYKVYTALLTQGGTNAPVATVLENTFTGSISFAYSKAGTYEIISSANEFTQNKTLTQIQVWVNSENKPRIGAVQWETEDKLILYTYDTISNTLQTGIGGNNFLTSIEIRVYN